MPNTSHSSFGLTISNTNFKFECLKTKIINNYIFITTKHNEILVYAREDKSFSHESLKKKYIILTTMQNRAPIIDLFLINQQMSLLSFESKVIIIISQPLLISYHNISDGLCFSKINLASFIIDDKTIKIYCINERFILIICSHKAILFDCYTQIVIKEEMFKWRKEKNNNSTIATTISTSYYIQASPSSINEKIKDKSKEKLKRNTRQEDQYQLFELGEVYQVKSSSFYLLSKDNETYFLNIPCINDIEAIGINFSITRIRIMKQSFRLNHYLNLTTANDNNTLIYFSNEELCAHYDNHRIYVSFLDSVEELTELSTYISKEKYPIKFLLEIIINKNNYLLAIHSNFIGKLFSYDKKLREIRLDHRFNILIDESDTTDIKFITNTNIMIGYTSHSILIYDLSIIQAQLKEFIVPISSINLINEINSNQINFTHYFTANFSLFINEVKRELGENTAITASVLFSDVDNKSLYYIIGTNEGKVGIFDVFFSESMLLNPLIMINHKNKHNAAISSLTIYNRRILIIASEDGVVSLTDIGLQKIEAAINKRNNDSGGGNNDEDKKDYGNNELNQNIRNSNSNRNFNYTIVKKASSHNKKITGKIANGNNNRTSSTTTNTLHTVTLIPFYFIKNYYPLNKIILVIPFNTTINNPNSNNQYSKHKSKHLIALETKDSSISIMKMDTYEIIYNYQSTSSLSIAIKAIYHLESTKSLLFYLNNNSIRLVSYLTKTMDRIITNISAIYNIMQIDEQLIKFFPAKAKNINDYITNITTSSLKYEEPDLKRKLKNKLDNQSPSMLEITIESIEHSITNNAQRELFIKKYYQNCLSPKQFVSYSSINNKGDLQQNDQASMIIDTIISIITNKSDEMLQKIQIINTLYNPQSFIDFQSICNDFIPTSKCECHNGIRSHMMEIGGQYVHCVSFDYEMYFNFIESVIKNQSDIDSNIFFRTNYFNWISLFHIWNFSVDLDTFLYKRFKLTQPIFEFKPVLIGVNGSCCLLFNEEMEMGKNIAFGEGAGGVGNKFSQHFDFYLHYINGVLNKEESIEERQSDQGFKTNLTIDELHQLHLQKKYISKNQFQNDIKLSIVISNNDNNSNSPKSLKKELFLNKTILLESYQPYLINLHNYQMSTTTSHHMHLCLFGSLISLLGYEINTDLCDFIDSLKKIMKILTSKHLIFSSDMTIFHQFISNPSDNLSLANNGLLLHDFFTMQHTLLNHSTKSKTNLNLNQHQFKSFLNNTITYLSKVYQYIFNLFSDDMIYYSFPQLNRDLNLDSCSKLEFLSSYELSLISFILTYNSIGISMGYNKLSNDIALKSCELLMLFIFKIINQKNSINFIKLPYVKIVIDQLEKSTEIIEEIYCHNMVNYTKILIDFYTNTACFPINLESIFKPFDIGNIKLIKSDCNPNFLKILLAKQIKSFSKTRLGHIIKFIVEEFKGKPSLNKLDYYTYLLELLWLLLRERHIKVPQYLPTIINLLIAVTSPINKELQGQCANYAKKTLMALISHYPMVAFNEITKRIIVGGTDGKVYVYDVDGGNLWKNWTAHEKEITAVIFDIKGSIVLTYSSTDCIVKFWTINFTNFISNLFAMKDGYYKQKKLGKIDEVIGYEIKLSAVRLNHITHKENEVVLHREDNTVEIFTL